MSGINIVFGVISTCLYIVSCYVNYKWLQKAFSEGGTYSYKNISFTELFTTFCPLLNTIAMAANLSESPYEEGHKEKLNKFFNVKK